MKSNILIVDDDIQMVSLLRTMLEVHGYPYLTAKNGRQALSQFLSGRPDIILLDLGLPDLDGMEVIRKLRSFSSVPILVLSARAEDSDIIDALDAGADDYLCKPFSVDQLMARLRVMERHLKQRKKEPDREVFENGDLYIDYQAQTVRLGQQDLHLTPIEYKLLVLLAQNTGKVLTRTYITSRIWGSAWESNMSSLRVYMTMLRKKLGHRYIETSFGVGYKMVREDEQSEKSDPDSVQKIKP